MVKSPIDAIEDAIDSVSNKVVNPGLDFATGAVETIEDAIKYAYTEAAEKAVEAVNIVVIYVGQIFPYLDNMFNKIMDDIKDKDPCKELIEELLNVYREIATRINDTMKLFINLINEGLENIEIGINSISNVSIKGINDIIKAIIDFSKEIENLNVQMFKLLSKLSFTIELFSLHPILYGITIIISIFFPKLETHKILGFVIIGLLVTLIGFFCTIFAILFFVSGLVKF
jgi:hypothetical protein